MSLLTFLTHVFPTGYGIKIQKGRTLGSSNADNYHSNHNLVPVDDQAYGGTGELFPSKSSIPRQFPHRASLAVDGEGIECRFIETRPVIIFGRHSPPYNDPACQQFRTGLRLTFPAFTHSHVQRTIRPSSLMAPLSLFYSYPSAEPQ